MNRQVKYLRGVLVGRGIEWTDFTWNPVGGCKHACRWEMPDGSIAICYAEETAHGVARAAYPRGFANHYYHPKRLTEPARLQTPARIFCDSMSDLMGAIVPAHQITNVFEAMREAPQHTFQLLTKYAPRLRDRTFPPNLWVGCSSPPDFMLGNHLSPLQQQKHLERSLNELLRVEENVTWMSFEPLSWDVSEIVAKYPGALNWAVIGAATNNAAVYQPDPDHIYRLLDVLDRQKVPVFFKGNLHGNRASFPWREYFPAYVPSAFLEAELEAQQPPAPKPIVLPADSEGIQLPLW